MFAYSYSKYGSPEVLEKVEVAKPVPNKDEVLIKIYATTVSAGDWRARSLVVPAGLGLVARLVFGVFGPRKPILGTEFSGVVEATGSHVSKFKPGDAVIGFPGAGFGAHAQYITMPSDGKLALMPRNITFEEAAAIPFGATTAYDFLVNKAGLSAGETVLINGASGSVGSACVQIAKHLGAHVTAVCSGRNVDLMHAIGADAVINYQEQDFAHMGPQYDMVVDTVGTAPFSRTQFALPAGGRMVMISGSAADMFFGGLRARLNGRRLIGGVAKESAEILETVVDMARDGAFSPVIDRCFSFDELPDAHAHVDTGHKVGNVVVKVDPYQTTGLAKVGGF